MKTKDKLPLKVEREPIKAAGSLGGTWQCSIFSFGNSYSLYIYFILHNLCIYSSVYLKSPIKIIII